MALNDFLSKSPAPRARRFSRAPGAIIGFVALLGGGFLQVDCSAPNAGSDGTPPSGSGGSTRVDVEISLGPGGEGGESSIHPLCGAGECSPRTNSGCRSEAATGGGGGAASDHDGGGDGPGGEGGLLGWGGSPSEAEPDSACRVVAADPCPEEGCEPIRRCGPSGDGRELDPCFGSRDCAAGLACVGDGAAGVCRPYCCDGRCSASSYCEVRTQVDAEIDVPVCVPFSNCSLDDPFPCPEGSVCSCGGKKACSLVGANGKTACLEPGPGKQGDPCSGTVAGECAAGHVCAKTLGCLSLCRRGDANSCAAGFACQVPPNFPEGLGVCVSTRQG